MKVASALEGFAHRSLNQPDPGEIVQAKAYLGKQLKLFMYVIVCIESSVYVSIMERLISMCLYCRE